MIDISPDGGMDLATYLGIERRAPVTDLQDSPAPKDERASEEPELKRPDITPLEATIALARRGNKRVLPVLRRTLREHPEIWQHFGNLALQTQESWLSLIAGTDLLLAETMRLHLDAMRTELAGPSPSPLDRLLIDRILACHVQVLYFDAMETTDPTADNLRVARYRMDRREQAHRQFLSAAKMLATVRQLAARISTIQVQFLNPPLMHPSAVPIVPTAHGDEPTRAAAPINRIAGLAQGCRNRVADMLEPV